MSTLITEASAEEPPTPQPSNPPGFRRQPTWRRIILLIVLGYEIMGCLSGGGLPVAAPDGHLMDMQVEGLHGFFPDFLIPGLLLLGLGILNIAALIAVWRRSRTDWLFSGLALGGLTVWFLVEIAVVGVHWLQAMWGLPVLLGLLLALPLVPPRAEGWSFIQRHPLSTYYLLTFAISWGSLALLIVGWTGILPTAQQSASLLLQVVFPFTIAGPAIAGLALTGAVDGRSGYRELASRLRRWRVGVRWWALAVLTGPLTVTLAVLVVGGAIGTGLPAIITTQDKLPMILLAVSAGLVVGACEETGWTGFAIPRFRLQLGVFGSGLMLGVLWGLWHMPSQFWASGDASGALRLNFFLGETVFAMAVLPAYRLLMVWVYDHAQSLLVALLMHAVLVMSLFALMPAGMSDVGYLTSCIGIALGLWLVVGAVSVATRGHLARGERRTQARSVAGGMPN